MVTMNDARTSHMIIAIPYAGLSDEEPLKKLKKVKKFQKNMIKVFLKSKLHLQKQLQENLNQSPQQKKIKIEKSARRPVQSVEFFDRELSQVVHNTHRSITCNNWFSSIPLFETMLVEYKISMTRTLRKNKPQIPTYFL